MFIKNVLEMAQNSLPTNCENINKMVAEKADSQTISMETYDLFICKICNKILCEPINLPCGPCVCKNCLKYDAPCVNCLSNHCFTKTKPNVVLSNLLSKVYTGEQCKTGMEANNDMSQSDIEISRIIYSLSLSQIDATDFQCSLCAELLLKPICTSCGHVYCKNCIERTLDYNNHCPLCKEIVDMTEDLVLDNTSQELISQFLPICYNDRLKISREEILSIKLNYPVFVCTLALPSIACPLHIFEPRYRLLVRRAMQLFERTFAMCMPSQDQPFNLVGTILYIKNIQYLKDGRSILETVGFKRIRCSNPRMYDGYSTADFTVIEDKKLNENETKEVDTLAQNVYIMSTEWFNSAVPNEIKTKIFNHYGHFPNQTTTSNIANGPDWFWWLLNILPINNNMKVKTLEKDSFKDRLLELKDLVIRLKPQH